MIVLVFLIVATLVVVIAYFHGETMTALTDLQAQVASNTTVVNSAATLISGLKTALDAAIAAQQDGDDGAALQALSSELAASDAALAAAVTANTPAAPTT